MPALAIMVGAVAAFASPPPIVAAPLAPTEPRPRQRLHRPKTPPHLGMKSSPRCRHDRDCDQVSSHLLRRPGPALRHVNLRIEEGELALSSGAPAYGKSTLLRVINGLVPHFSGGTLAGAVLFVRVARRGPRHRASWPTWSALSARIPLAGFVTDTVEEELAYTMEQLGVPLDVDAQSTSRNPRLVGRSPNSAPEPR